MQFRQAVKNDATSIAHLHARSWQHTYRGMLEDEYLNKAVLVEKQQEWQQRLGSDFDQKIWVLLAEADQQLRGFSCLFFDYGSQGETYMDNLHVDPTAHGTGIGAQLLGFSLKHAHLNNPQVGVYLWVFENNHHAINFYLHHGAKIIGDEIQDAPGGGKIKALKLFWAGLT